MGASKKKKLCLWLSVAVVGIVAAAVIIRLIGPVNPQEESTEADAGGEAMRRFMALDWDEVEPREFLTDPDWSTNVICLGEIPEEDIALYGYNDEDYYGVGVAIEVAGNVNYFDWYYMTPRAIMPKLYFNDENQQLQISMTIFTGTGVNAEELHILQLKESKIENEWQFTINDYSKLLEERIGYSYDEDTQILTYYDTANDQELVRVDVSWLEGNPVTGIAEGNIVGFRLGDEIWMDFEIGYMVEGWAIPQYDKVPVMEAKVYTELDESTGELVFSLGEIHVQSSATDAFVIEMSLNN